jgi:TRAP-type C4-dicarboxylate transport system permease small subunit
MLPEKKTKTNVGVGIGILLQLAGFVLSGVGETGRIVGLLLILVSIPVFIWGCMNYAEGKGHSKWVGLVGLAGIIGLIVLIVLPDQHKEAS